MTSLVESEMYQSLRPAQRVAALSALKDALEQQIKLEKAKVLDVAREVGVKSFNTEFGGITVVDARQPIIIDEVKLLDYVRESAPELIETVETIPDWYHAQLTGTKNLQIIDGEVYDLKGTHLPYASLGEAGDPYVTWPSSPAQKAGKAQAAEFVKGNVGALSASVLGLDPLPQPEVLVVPEQVEPTRPVAAEPVSPLVEAEF